jgi:PAS domain S-box-containing protein
MSESPDPTLTPAGHLAPLQERSPTSDGLRLLRTLIEQSADAIIVRDARTGVVVDVNQQAEAMYGYRRAEFFAFGPGWDLRTADERASGEGLFELALRGGEMARRPRWHQRKDGSALPVEASINRIEIDGRPLLVMTLRDVSSYLGTEAELVGRLVEVEGLLELSTLLSTEDDLNTVLDRIVEGGVRCVGAAGGSLALPEGDCIVTRRLFRDGAWQPRVLSLALNGSTTGLAFRSGETVAVDHIATDPRTDQAAALISPARALLTAPVKGQDGRVLAVLSLHERLDGQPYTSRDIALAEAAARHAGFALERAQAQAVLAEREAHFRALMQQAQDAVLVLDPASGRLLDANQSAATLLGRSVEEMAAMQPFDVRTLSDPLSHPRILDVLAAGTTVARVRRLWQRRDGTEVPVEVNANYVDGPRGRVAMVVARDISDQVRAEVERNRFDAQMQARAREIEVLLEVTAALNAAETEEAVVRAVAERATMLSGTRIAGIGLWRGDHLAIMHVRRDGVWEQRDYHPPATGSIIERVMTTGRAYRSNDLANDPYTDHASDQQMGFHSQLAVPIVGTNDQVIGVISVHDKLDGTPFSGQDEALMGALAAQSAVALERARSRKELAQTVAALKLAHGERDIAQRSAEQRRSELGAMVDLTTAVAAGGDLDAVFAALSARVAEIAGFDVVLLNTYDAPSDSVTFRSLYHRLARPPRPLFSRRGRTYPAGSSPLYRQFAAGGGPLVGHGTARADTRGFTGIWAGATGLDLMVTMPLRYEGALMGDLSFAALQDREISPDELRLLEALAGQVAVAAHGARDVARIRQMREDAVFRLAAACEARDPETGVHLRRIQSLTTLLAGELGMPPDEVEELSLASVLHDVGKIVVPDAILWKPGRLDPEEFMIVKMHAAQGEAMLTGPEFYATARSIARHHHERWDGSGYPDSRAGADIPWPARIAAVADVFDALVSPRVYKHAWDPEAAAQEILGHAGTHFDPRVVEAFEALWHRDAVSAGITAA